jgi:phage host-nuclease inhibitor protein Gam
MTAYHSDIEFFGEEEKQVEQGFVIDSLEKAEWAISKIVQADVQIDRFTVMAETLKARIEARLAEIVKNHHVTKDAMISMLRPWAEVEIAKQGKARSMKLLGGTVGFRQAPSRLEVMDEAAALKYFHDRQGAQDCIRVKEEVSKTAAKKLIEQTGEIPDGCELKSGEVSFYAEPLPPLLEK